MADARENLAAGLSPAGTRSPHAAAAAWLEAHQRVAACVVSFLVLLALHRLHPLRGFPFDAGEYWLLANPAEFLARPVFRGYLFPALLAPLRWLAERGPDHLGAFGVLAALVQGVALPLLVPAFFERVFGGRVSFWRRLVPVLLLALLFPGLLLYPLSDLPALEAVLAGILAGKLALSAEGRQRWAWWAAAGFCIAAGYNIRPIYLFALPALPLLLFWQRGGMRAKALALACIAGGALAVSLPQALANQRSSGNFSFAVLARVEGQPLFDNQLAWGLTLQRYESSIGGPGFAAGGVHYLDPAGEQLFRRFAQEPGPFGIGAYVRMALRHPLDFAGMYVRHAVNGLDVRDGLVYVEQPSPPRAWLALLNFAVLAAAGWVLASRRHAIAAPSQHPWPAAVAMLLLPVGVIMAGAVETRFFLPLHLLAYGAIAFGFDPVAMRRTLATSGWKLAMLTAALAAMYFGITTSTMSHMRMDWPEEYRKGLAGK